MTEKKGWKEKRKEGEINKLESYWITSHLESNTPEHLFSGILMETFLRRYFSYIKKEVGIQWIVSSSIHFLIWVNVGFLTRLFNGFHYIRNERISLDTGTKVTSPGIRRKKNLNSGTFQTVVYSKKQILK